MSSSEQARADALSDADTLANSGVIRLNGPEFGLIAAALFGSRAVQAVYGVQFKHRGIFEESRLAARAAFRAVPGLRGE